MAIEWTNYVWNGCPVTGPSQRLVLLALADRADPRGFCRPGVADTARRARLSERQTRRVLAGLVAAGEIRIVRRGGGRKRSGAGWTNGYLLTGGRSADELDKLTADTLSPATGYRGRTSGPNPDAGDRKPCHRGPATLTPATGNPDAGDRGTVTETATEPLREPSERLSGERVAEAVAAVGPVDPKQAEFARVLSERQADTARKRGALTGSPVSSDARQVINKLVGDPERSCQGGRRKRRIPDLEQEATFALLKRVDGLREADARNLATIGTCAEFKAALALMNGQTVRNVGGFLRRAVTEGWASEPKRDTKEKTRRT